jgi:hypothetical protein
MRKQGLAHRCVEPGTSKLSACGAALRIHAPSMVLLFLAACGGGGGGGMGAAPSIGQVIHGVFGSQSVAS